jgi:cytochrome c553
MSNLVPVLHGQPAEFLVSALNAYAEGKRRSGIMQPLAADLRAEDIRTSLNIMPVSRSLARKPTPRTKP